MRRLLVALATVLLFCTTMSAQEKPLSGDRIATDNGDLFIHPVNHATFVMQWNGKTVYVDPVGGAKPFADLPKPDLVLVTHIHFDPATLAFGSEAPFDRIRSGSWRERQAERTLR